MNIEKRNIGIAILLTIVTCGLYSIFWFICLNDEINALAGDTNAPSGAVAFLLSLVTCGIYSYFWMYKMGEKLDNVAVTRGESSQSRGILYLILAFFGLSIVSYALMQDGINKSI